MADNIALRSLSCDEAIDAYWAFEAGVDVEREFLADIPIIAIEVSPADAARLPSPPVHFPGVVVVVAGDVDTSNVVAAGDIALTEYVSLPPSPWVGVDSCQSALGVLAARVATFPVAAVTLAQLLRAGRGLSIEQGLTLESLAYSTLQAGSEFARWIDRRPRSPAHGHPEPTEVALVARFGDVVRITLNRPELHNAYNKAMRDALYEVLSAATLDPSVEVELCANGPSFCSGGDLSEFATAANPALANLVRTERSPARLLAALSTRLAAVVHGYCAGSGIELAAFASVVRAREEVTIWLPELSMGLIPGAGGTVSLPRRIGATRTAWLALSGTRIDTSIGVSWGLLDGWL